MSSSFPQHLFKRFWAIAGAVSVRTKILGIILGLVLLLGLGITGVVRQSLRQVMVKELEARAVSVAHDLASRSTDLILINDLYALHQLLKETQANHPDMRYAFVVDSFGQVRSHTFGEGFPVGLLTANTVSPSEHHRTVVLDTTEGYVWDLAVPIFDGRAGIVRAGFSDDVLRRTEDVVTSQLLLATLLVSTAGVVAAIFLTWFLTRPILELVGAARAVGHGDLTRRASRWADDEIGDLADAFNAMVIDLSQAAEERRERDRLRIELIERVITAQEDERKRIARDLHDQTSQSLVSLIVQLKLVESAPDDATRAQSLTELREQLRSVLGEVRRMALDLRPSVLDDLGLVQAIQWFAERCCHNGKLAVMVTSCGDCCDHLPPRQALALYRVTQEALSNVVKHSDARHVWVNLQLEDGRLVLEVRDDGRGFDPRQAHKSGGGMGLFSMEERIHLLDGTFEAVSSPGTGTRVSAAIVLKDEGVIL